MVLLYIYIYNIYVYISVEKEFKAIRKVLWKYDLVFFDFIFGQTASWKWLYDVYFYLYIHIYIYIYIYYIYIYIYTYIYIYIYIYIYNEMCVVEEWVELFCNLYVLSVDLATSSDCYKYELTSALATIYSCSSSHYLMLYSQNMFSKLWRQIWDWFNQTAS